MLLDEAIAELEAVVPETTSEVSVSGPSHQGARSASTAEEHSEDSDDSDESDD